MVGDRGGSGGHGRLMVRAADGAPRDPDRPADRPDVWRGPDPVAFH